MTATEPPILLNKHPLDKGKFIGMITLNRPKALNALTFEMIGILRQTLKEWRDDSAVVALLVKGAGERAFCAGGGCCRCAQCIPE